MADLPTHLDRAETILDALRKWWGLPQRHPADDDHSELRLIRTHLDAVRAEGEAERDTLRRALEESRGQTRTLRLTLDQGVEAEAALCAEIRHLKAELRREREANRPLRHEVEQARAERDALRIDLTLAAQASERVARAARAMIAARWAYEYDTNVDTAEAWAQAEVQIKALLGPEKTR